MQSLATKSEQTSIAQAKLNKTIKVFLKKDCIRRIRFSIVGMNLAEFRGALGLGVLPFHFLDKQNVIVVNEESHLVPNITRKGDRIQVELEPVVIPVTFETRDEYVSKFKDLFTIEKTIEGFLDRPFFDAKFEF